jgi:hypothetical protein
MAIFVLFGFILGIERLYHCDWWSLLAYGFADRKFPIFDKSGVTFSTANVRSAL